MFPEAPPKKRLVFAPSASAQIREAVARWAERYPEVPKAFTFELKRHLEMLQGGYGPGLRSKRHRDDVYRLPMRRVRANLYYRDYEKRVEVVSLIKLADPPPRAIDPSKRKRTKRK